MSIELGTTRDGTMTWSIDVEAWKVWIDDVITKTLEKHRGWYRPAIALQEGETNYRMTELFNDLRRLVPFEFDDSIPPEQYSAIPDEWRAANEIVRQLWYQACARAFQLEVPKPVKRAKQLTLF